MARVTDYLILTGLDTLGDADTDLTQQVEMAIGEGWQPFGSPWGAVSWSSQAMVKYAEED